MPYNKSYVKSSAKFIMLFFNPQRDENMSFSTDNHLPPVSLTTPNLQSNVSNITPKAKPLPTPPRPRPKNTLSINGDIARTAQGQITQASWCLSRPSNPLQAKVKQQPIQSTMPCRLRQENVCPLLQGDDINAKDLSNGASSPLFLAVQEGHREVVQSLLQSKTALNITSCEQETVLHAAAFYGYTEILYDLLTNPDCKQLINAKDRDGKTPLHKAVWGSPKSDAVIVLIANGADVNATNNCGYTPLHWASKHGHSESAAILVKNGAKIDLVNTSGDLPFDLAIRHGKDDLIHVFLQTSRRLPKQDIVVNDIEWHHAKLLLAAKKEGLLEEQIFHLQIISYLYIQKKDFLRGAKLLNASLALLYQHPAFGPHLAIFERYVFARLEQIEAMFLESKQVKTTILMPQLVEYRRRLKEIRTSCKIAHVKGQEIQKILFTLTTEFKLLLSSIISDVQEILGPVPVRWACIGMGSMSRDEMCPFSDVEFAFLVEEETSESMSYFRTLSQIIELRIINLGETEFPSLGESFPSPTPNGFCMDTGGNTPLGMTGIYELIGTPTTLAKFQQIRWMDRNIILPNAMSHVCLVAGTEGLLMDYNVQKQIVQESIDRVSKSNNKNHKVLAMRLLEGHIKEFSPKLSAEKEAIHAFGIKYELYRPIQEVIAALSLFYQLQSKTTFTRIDELVNLKVFTSKGAENLKKAIYQVLTLRLEAHLFYENEEEFLCHIENDKPLDPCLMYFSEKTINILSEIYKVLIPFHNCGKAFLTSNNKQAFYGSDFHDDSPTLQGETFELKLKYVNAQETFQQAVSLNPNDVDAILRLSGIEDKLGNSKNALIRNLKALELAQQQHGENHQKTAECYDSIGSVYYSLGFYHKSLENHRKALEIGEKVLCVNHRDLALTYNNIGAVHRSLADYDQALGYHQKALEILLKYGDKKHIDTVIIYSDIALAYEKLDDSLNAIKYHRMALNIIRHIDMYHPLCTTVYNNMCTSMLQQFSVLGFESTSMPTLKYTLPKTKKKALESTRKIFGENSPAVANSYYQIAYAHDIMGDFNKALENYQKVFQIRLKILDKNHPEMAAIYDKIGCVYHSLKKYNESLENHRKALDIKLQESHGNHPEVAATYDNIGGVYYSLQEYAQTIEYYIKALKIRLQAFGKTHPEVAGSFTNMGNAYIALCDYENAMQCFHTSFEIWCDRYSKNPLSLYHVEIILKKIIALAKSLPSSQRKNLEYTYSLCTKTLGENHKLTKELSKFISPLSPQIYQTPQPTTPIIIQHVQQNHTDPQTQPNLKSSSQPISSPTISNSKLLSYAEKIILRPLEKQTNIINQRINILDRINNLYDEINKLEDKLEECEEEGKVAPEAIEAQVEAKRKELEEAKEMLRKFNMRYGK